MKHILYAIAFILLLGVNILAWAWLLYMKRKGTFESVEWDWDGWCLHWDVSNDSDFYKNTMEGWWGFVLGSNIIYVDYFPKLALDKQHIKHEKTHVLQNYIFNIFFYPIYYLHSLYLWIFKWEKNVYYDNFFERWARRAAGQRVDIPPEDWTNGPNDRCPWW